MAPPDRGYRDGMRIAPALAAAALGAAVAVRAARSRDRRLLHPDGRSFTGDLEIWGTLEPTGAELIDRPGRHPVTLRISKGIGTRPGLPDILGVALRVHGPVAGRRPLPSYDPRGAHAAQAGARSSRSPQAAAAQPRQRC